MQLSDIIHYLFRIAAIIDKQGAKIAAIEQILASSNKAEAPTSEPIVAPKPPVNTERASTPVTEKSTVSATHSAEMPVRIATGATLKFGTPS